MSQEELADLLDNGNSVPIGNEIRARNRMHHLFYSVTDQTCFVAVRDEKTGEVVTVLPMNFDNHCRVADSALAMVIRENGLRTDPVTIMEKAEKPKPNPKAHKRPTYRFTLYFRNLQKKFRLVTLSIPSEGYPQGLAQLESDPTIHEQIRELAKSSAREDEVFDDVFVQFGKKGNSTRFVLKKADLTEANFC